MDRGAWWATVHAVAESDMTEWLSLSLSLGGILESLSAHFVPTEAHVLSIVAIFFVSFN